MNLGITPANQNINCKRNNSPQFGMAIKLDKSAHPIIKKQAVALRDKSRNNFFTKLKQAVERQESNPVNILIRKAKHRNALAAEVVDSEIGKSMGGVKNQVTSQPLIGKNGSLKFLDKAEKKANKLNETNNEVKKIIDEIPAAEAKDYGKGSGYITEVEA